MENSSEDDGSLRDVIEPVDLNDGTTGQQMPLDASIHSIESCEPNSSIPQSNEIAEPFIGMEFESEEAAKMFYMAYASRVGFSVRISKSRRSRNDESIIMRRFVCSKEGFHTKKDNFDDGKKRRKRATIREGCKAMIEVIQKYYGRWVVTKFEKEHNHLVSPPSRVRYVAPEEYADLEPFLGMEFHSHEDAQTFYYAYASRVGFEVRIRLSRRSTRDDTFVMRRFVCTKEGFSTCEENLDDNKRKRSRAPTREGCKAMFEVIKKEYDRWVVSKLETEHTHPLAIAPSKVHYIQSQSEVVVLAKSGTITQDIIMASPSPAMQVGDSGGLGNSPTPAVQESRKEIRELQPNSLGRLEDSQNLIEYFKRTQAENPTFYYAFQVDKNNCLTNVFWADAKAKMAYYCFGDAVVFDTSCKDNKDMMPFVTFTGVNHHLQCVVFGCALLTDESEATYIWLFENWSIAMCGRPPISLITEPNNLIKLAVVKIFPGTRHLYNKYYILAKYREKLSNICATHACFEGEFEKCINQSETIESFELCWNSIMEQYSLRGNSWLQWIYDIREQWVSVYLKDTFTAEASTTRQPDSMCKFFEKYFNSKTSLLVLVSLFEQAMSGWLENEALEDFANMYTKPVLKTPSFMLKHASEFYTRTIFDIFQDEFVESLGYFGDKIEEGEVVKYNVARDEDIHSLCTVTYLPSEKKASCSCCKFEASGILCRHILRVFLIVGVRSLPEDYILKRWTKSAKSGFISDECVRYNDLCRDALKYAKEGSSSIDAYKVAKESLQIAFAEVVAAKKDILNRCTM